MPACHRLALVDGVRDHTLQASGQAYRFERPLVGDTVGAGVVTVVENDLLLAKVPVKTDQPRGVACDAGDLLAGLCRFGRPVYAYHPPPAPCVGHSNVSGDFFVTNLPFFVTFLYTALCTVVLKTHHETGTGLERLRAPTEETPTLQRFSPG